MGIATSPARKSLPAITMQIYAVSSPPDRALLAGNPEAGHRREGSANNFPHFSCLCPVIWKSPENTTRWSVWSSLSSLINIFSVANRENCYYFTIDFRDDPIISNSKFSAIFKRFSQRFRISYKLESPHIHSWTVC